MIFSVIQDGQSATALFRQKMASQILITPKKTKKKSSPA
jgi:hypothetical protein